MFAKAVSLLTQVKRCQHDPASRTNQAKALETLQSSCLVDRFALSDDENDSVIGKAPRTCSMLLTGGSDALLSNPTWMSLLVILHFSSQNAD